MRLFSERYKAVEGFPLVTYSEVVEVKYGYTESENQNTIKVLKSRKWGFVEVVPAKETDIPKAEEAPGKPVLEPESSDAVEPKAETEPKAEKGKPKGNKKSGKGKPNAALAESDVDALTGRH